MSRTPRSSLSAVARPGRSCRTGARTAESYGVVTTGPRRAPTRRRTPRPSPTTGS
ncbi:hypothetical protein ACFPM0_30625 [Pseudonocardia sulfidoxydans]|uniref:hypothetical protein n=1 Tax=Pseudonocardia sulfidoxydans TaxID=54011 RepID=UPI0036138FD2